jgi:hypothetical protein
MIMPNRTVFALLLLTLLSFPLTIWAGEVTKVENYNYPLASGGKFAIADANGTIAISCWDRNEVQITATKHAENRADLDAIRVDTKQEGDSIEVRTVYTRQGLHNGGVSYQVTVPKDIGSLLAKTANGSISAENIAGDVTMKSENGAITATNLKGAFSLDTTKGSISAVCTDLAGDGHHHTTNGSITLA